MFPNWAVQERVIREVSARHTLLFSDRSTVITDHVCITAFEIAGTREAIEAAIEYFDRRGIHTAPAELSAIEG